MSQALLGLYAVLTPLVAVVIGSIVLTVKRGRTRREAAARSSRSRMEIERILLAAKIREAKRREAQ